MSLESDRLHWRSLMSERYRLRLTAGEAAGGGRVVMALHGDARATVGYLLAAAETVSEDDPPAREQLYRLAVLLAARLAARLGSASSPPPDPIDQSETPPLDLAGEPA
jgi:hypothetical protein